MSDARLKIEEHFHALIRRRVEELVAPNDRADPDLPRLQSLAGERLYFAYPGMYGGFTYRFDPAAEQETLIVESWSRIVGYSGEEHAITESGTTLLDQGFV